MRDLVAQWLLGVVLALAPATVGRRSNIDRPAVVLPIGESMPSLAAWRLSRSKQRAFPD